MPVYNRFTVYNRKNALTSAAALASAAGIALSPGFAVAQLATSPQPVNVPEVSITAPAEAPKAARPAKAPAAAEQSSTPRATRKVEAGPAPAPSTPQAAIEPGPSAAAEPAEAATVTVAPTGTTTPVDQIGSSVTVITGQEIEAQQRRTAPDLLRSVPGINVVQIGGTGGLTSVFTRGTNSNATKVLIDGIDVSDPASSNRTFDFSQLSLFDIERVEVLRGPQSGLYGADALGGVIAVYSKKGDGPFKFDSLVEAGSFGTLNEAISARGSSGRFNYAFSISHINVDRTPVTPLEIIGPGARRVDNSYQNWTYATKLGFDVSPELTFNVAARYIDSTYGFQESPASSDKATTIREQFFTRGEAIWSVFGGRVKNYFGINYTDAATQNLSPTFPSTYDGARVKYDWRTVAVLTPGITLTVGADYQTERLTAPENQFAPALGVEEYNRGGYLQAQAELVHNLFVAANLRQDENQRFGEATTWRVAPAYVFDLTGTKIKGSAGTAFKAPTLSQRFQDSPPFFFGNRDLKAEESTGYDLGFEQPLFGNRAQLGATYFFNDIKNLINSSADFSTLVNVDRARTSGVEMFGSADLSDTVRLRADYTYTKAIDVGTGLDLLRRPRQKVTVSAGWQALQPLLLTASVTYLGETFDFDRVTFDTVRQPGFALVNVAANYKLNDTMSLFGRIDNLFDRRYQSPNGYEGNGIGAYGGIRFHN